MNEFSLKSRLLHHEHGLLSVQPFRNYDRLAVVTYSLDSSPQGGRVYVLARRAKEDAPPLHVKVNGKSLRLSPVAPCEWPARWMVCDVPAGVLSRGKNSLTIDTAGGWQIAVEESSGHPVVRLRVEDASVGGTVHKPLYGDSSVLASRDNWLNLLPSELRQPGERWEWCRSVAGYVSAAWRCRGASTGGSYTPWDAHTILHWAQRGCDDDGTPAIVMCVHYTVFFVQVCQASGIPVRAVVGTPNLNSPFGHFAAEVWLEGFEAWALIDPNLNLWFSGSDGRPLSVREVSSLGSKARSLVQRGAGHEILRQIQGPEFPDERYLSGEVFRHWGIWPRHDWHARPEFQPPAHGCSAYSEVCILWHRAGLEVPPELGMFPNFLSAAELDRYQVV